LITSSHLKTLRCAKWH